MVKRSASMMLSLGRSSQVYNRSFLELLLVITWGRKGINMKKWFFFCLSKEFRGKYRIKRKRDNIK